VVQLLAGHYDVGHCGEDTKKAGRPSAPAGAEAALHNYRHSFRYPPSYSVVIEEALELLFAREGIEIPDIPDDDQPSH
jgi:hypothetical protein